MTAKHSDWKCVFLYGVRKNDEAWCYSESFGEAVSHEEANL